ncbi:MAG: class I SAM-dependent methyltransferase [Christensenellales bacterium]
MSLGWIDVQAYSFNCCALFERFQIRLLCGRAQCDPQFARALGVALAGNETVAWCWARRSPESARQVADLVERAPKVAPEALRRAEVTVLGVAEDFVIYGYPELMDTHCDFIRHWNPTRLLEMADFTGKVVLDVGSGSGRLAFAAAPLARRVIASEPVATLREYLRDRIAREGIGNMSVVDGMADHLPYLDDTFDIVMSGHVVGDDFEAELTELTRVTRDGGWILDCPGEEPRKRSPEPELLRRGFKMDHYVSALGGDVYRYRKQVSK